MAAALINCTRAAIGEFTKVTALGCTTSIRGKKKKGQSVTKNKRTKTNPKFRGWKKYDGDYVESGMILYRQLGLRVYPGLNVGVSKDLTLFAQEPGRVMITVEKLSPHPHSPLYPLVKQGQELYKDFFHVIPDEQEPRFKLVSQT